ncbi:MAG: hypothetical protein LQ350_000663 [Teloschistes chrysophthalmus]|nr:MAG: hypothetical protein LQ350_000663 [Niorma chrysophthalma]
MAEMSADSLFPIDFDPRTMRYSYNPRLSWPVSPMPIDQTSSPSAPHWSTTVQLKRSTSPLETIDSLYDQSQDPQAHQHYQTQSQDPQAQQHYQTQQQPFIPQWPVSQPSAANLGYHYNNTYPQQFAGDYTTQYHTSPTTFMSNQNPLDTALPMDGSYIPLGGQMDNMSLNWQFPNDLMGYAAANGLPDISLPQSNLADSSPTGSYLDARSLTNSSNDGWVGVEYHPSYGSIDAFQDVQPGAISNPEQTLHPRSFSDSSYSDGERQSQHSFSSFVDVPPHAVGSPGSDSFGEAEFYNIRPRQPEGIRPSPPTIVPTTAPRSPMAKKAISPQRSPTSTGRNSPPTRRQSRKNISPKTTKSVIRRPTQPPKALPETSEKKVGKRRGPLQPHQRKQASEIHWKADCERHPSLDFAVGNIKGVSDAEYDLYITHGYGYYLPIRAREVFVMDDRYFGTDWVEKIQDPEQHEVNTMRWTTSPQGVSSARLSEYLDKHIELGFESFVDNYFEGTPFLTQMVKTVYHYWKREKTPVIRKSLKLLLAYNLTQHITLVEGIPIESGCPGRIYDENSRFRGKIVAPVMINFQVKTAMAEMWRDLQKDVLEELSTLYSSVYTRDKLKHWPTIFMVATILLTVWEEMQFDCHYRILDKTVVNRFCSDMESTPVGVIVNLFLAISQKLPALSEWDSHKHEHLLNYNPAVCDALTEVRENVNLHDDYLRRRCNATFDRSDFDSLSNKFTSKLVIRAN